MVRVSLFQALKRHRSISFFFSLYGVIWSTCIEQNLTLKRWNPRLTLELSASTSLSQLHLSSLLLSLIIVAAHSLPCCYHSYSIASLPRLQSTLSIVILLSFMSIYIFCPIFEGNQVYFSNKNNNQEREKKIQSMFLAHYSLLICCCKDLWL